MTASPRETAMRQTPEPPDKATVAFIDTTGQEVPYLYERDDNGGHSPDDEDRWYDQSLDAYTWDDLVSAQTDTRRLVRLYREDDSTVAILPLPAGAADISVAVAALSVSPLPVGDPNRRHCEVLLRPRPGGRFVAGTNAGQFLDADGRWSYGSDPSQQWRDTHWHTWDRAVELAADAARGMLRGLRMEAAR